MVKKEITFAEATQQLDFLIKEIESGQFDMEQIMQKVEQSIELIKFCEEKIYKSEDKIKKMLVEIEK